MNKLKMNLNFLFQPNNNSNLLNFSSEYECLEICLDLIMEWVPVTSSLHF
jgi:hypothetical protein